MVGINPYAVIVGWCTHAGYCVLKDYAHAHMWLNIAASLGHEKALEVREFIEKDMTLAAPLSVLWHKNNVLVS